jgi:hypothetical protein
MVAKPWVVVQHPPQTAQAVGSPFAGCWVGFVHGVRERRWANHTSLVIAARCATTPVALWTLRNR